jgi:hypothetical protein
MNWLLDPQLNLPVELRALQHTARRVCTVESTQIYLFQAVLAADPLLLQAVAGECGAGWPVLLFQRLAREADRQQGLPGD